MAKLSTPRPREQYRKQEGGEIQTRLHALWLLRAGAGRRYEVAVVEEFLTELEAEPERLRFLTWQD